MDNQQFQREYYDEACAALEIDPEMRTMPLLRSGVRLHPHQIVGVYWMLQMEEGLAGGGLLADDCGTGKVYQRSNLNRALLDADLADFNNTGTIVSCYP